MSYHHNNEHAHVMQDVIAHHVAILTHCCVPRIEDFFFRDHDTAPIDEAELQFVLEHAIFSEVVDDAAYGDVTQDMVDDACEALGLVL